MAVLRKAGLTVALDDQAGRRARATPQIGDVAGTTPAAGTSVAGEQAGLRERGRRARAAQPGRAEHRRDPAVGGLQPASPCSRRTVQSNQQQGTIVAQSPAHRSTPVQQGADGQRLGVRRAAAGAHPRRARARAASRRSRRCSRPGSRSGAAGLLRQRVRRQRAEHEPDRAGAERVDHHPAVRAGPLLDATDRLARDRHRRGRDRRARLRGRGRRRGHPGLRVQPAGLGGRAGRRRRGRAAARVGASGLRPRDVHDQPGVR